MKEASKKGTPKTDALRKRREEIFAANQAVDAAAAKAKEKKKSEPARKTK